MTYTKELSSFAREVARRTFHDAAQVTRAEQIFAARYGATADGTTLAAISVRHKLSRERVTQIMRLLVVCAKSAPPLMRNTEALFQEIMTYMPAPVALADRQFRRQLGSNASTADVLRFASDILGKPVIRPLARRIPGSSKSTHIISPKSRRAWAAEAWRLAVAQTGRYGAAQLYLIAGRLAQSHRVAVSRRDLVRALGLHPNFRWLDEKSGWFFISSISSGPFEERLRKLLAVAGEGGVSLDEFLEAMATDSLWNMNDAELGPLQLHYKIAKARLRTLKFVTIQHTHIIARVPLRPAQVLSKTEREVVRTIEGKGGVARVLEIIDALRAAGLSESAARLTLSTSPIVRSIQRGVYGLRCRSIDPEALRKAVSRSE
jgi:hypothetical protein